MINTPKKPERIFNVTFTDGGEVFIQAMDEAHARRIVDGKAWSRSFSDGRVACFTRTVKKVGKVNR